MYKVCKCNLGNKFFQRELYQLQNQFHETNKMFEIPNKDDSQQIMKWNQDGDGFLIENIDGLVNTVLKVYYKESSFFSFVRQLNQYGFSKQKINTNQYIFKHKNFIRNDQELMKNIISQHKIKRKQMQENYKNQIFNLDQQTLMTAMKDIQQNQKQICTQFSHQVNLSQNLKSLIVFLKNKIISNNLVLERHVYVTQMLLVKLLSITPSEKDHNSEFDFIKKVLQEFSKMFIECYGDLSNRSQSLSRYLTPIPFQQLNDSLQIEANIRESQLQQIFQDYVAWVQETYKNAVQSFIDQNTNGQLSNYQQIQDFYKLLQFYCKFDKLQ